MSSSIRQSFQKKYACPYPPDIDENALEDCLRGFIARLTQWVRSRSGMVGHIKILSDGRRNIWLSSTGKETYVKNTASAAENPQKLILFVTAIVFKVPHDELNGLCEEFLKASLAEAALDLAAFQ